METKELIDRRIEILEAGISDLTPGTEEYKMMADAIAELIKIRASIEKDEADSVTTTVEAKKDRWTRIGTTAFSVLAPLGVYSILWRQGLKFEKDGYVSSTSVKNLFQRFKFF